MKSKRRRRYQRLRTSNKNYIYVLVAAVAVIIAGTAGATLAYLSHQSGLTNQFQIAEVSTEIKETFDGGNTKTDVSVQNTGDVPAYIRAAVIIGWEDAEGNPLIDENAPKVDEDYTMTMNLENSLSTDGEWVLANDGYYYYTMPVAGQDETAILINKCEDIKFKDHKAAGKYLVVDIAAQSIQAEPAAAVLDAWGNGSSGPVTDVDETTGGLTITKDSSNQQAGGGA